MLLQYEFGWRECDELTWNSFLSNIALPYPSFCALHSFIVSLICKYDCHVFLRHSNGYISSNDEAFFPVFVTLFVQNFFKLTLNVIHRIPARLCKRFSSEIFTIGFSTYEVLTIL
jgi:hypothetical protein